MPEIEVMIDVIREILSHPRAWTKQFEDYGPRYCGFCLHLLGDHDDDCPMARAQKLLTSVVVQQAFINLGPMQRGLLTELLTEAEVSTVNYRWTHDVQPLVKAGYITLRPYQVGIDTIQLATITNLGRAAIAAQPDPLNRLKETK